MDLLIEEKDETKLQKNQILAARGRLPWFDTDGKPEAAYLIGVAGGSASGKSSVAKRIIRSLGVPWVLVISMDSFYKGLTAEQSEKAFRNEYDFDSPDAFDYPALRQCISDLRQSKAVQIPIYRFEEHQRSPETQYIYGASVIIVEGILALHDSELRDMLDLKVFVQCDSDLMLVRRIMRDIKDRGRDVEGVLQQYLKFVKPSFDNHILPTSRHADIIMPGSSNSVAAELIVSHVRKELDARSRDLRNHLSQHSARHSPTTSKSGANDDVSGSHEEDGLDNVTVLNNSDELVGALRSPKTPTTDFQKSSDRLADLLIAKALEMSGDDDMIDRICAVAIAGVGGRLKEALHRSKSSIPTGSLTIESHEDSSEPVLCETELPDLLKTSHEQAAGARVLLLDSQVGTGAAAIMAIRVLLDHGVPESSIILICFVCSRRGGCRALQSAFPGVRILTSYIDEGLNLLQGGGHSVVKGHSGGDRSRHPWTTFFVDPGP